MKKITLLFSLILLYCISGKAQTLNPSPSTAVSGGSIAVTVSGETNSNYYNILGIDYTLTTTSSPSTFLTAWVNATITQYTNDYNIVLQTPSSFTMNVTNGYNQAITATFAVKVDVLNNGSITQFNVTKYVTITINPAPPPTYYNVAKSVDFRKNDCTAPNVGSVVPYSVAANTYSSTTSQADADAQALTYINANGQANANANGTCAPVPCPEEPSELDGSYISEMHKLVVTFIGDPNATSYNLYINGVFIRSTTGSANFNMSSYPCGEDDYYVEIEAVNACGTSSKAGINFFFDPCD